MKVVKRYKLPVVRYIRWSMVKNPSVKAEDTGSVSDPGRPHMMCSN